MHALAAGTQWGCQRGILFIFCFLLHLQVHPPAYPPAKWIAPTAVFVVQDPVYSIREAAIQVLQAVGKEFGPDWAREHIVPQVGGRACVFSAAVLFLCFLPLPGLPLPAAGPGPDEQRQLPAPHDSVECHRRPGGVGAQGRGAQQHASRRGGLLQGVGLPGRASSAVAACPALHCDPSCACPCRTACPT